MRPVKEDNYLRVSRNFVAKRKVVSLDEFARLPYSVVLCTIHGAMFPILHFQTMRFEKVARLILGGNLFYCDKYPLSEAPLKYQYNWEIAYNQYTKDKLNYKYYYEDKIPDRIHKRLKIIEMRLIKYKTLLKRLEESVEDSI